MHPYTDSYEDQQFNPQRINRTPQDNGYFYAPSSFNPGNAPFPPYSVPFVNNPSQAHSKLTTSLWEDERTLCYQINVRGICVARRQGNPAWIRITRLISSFPLLDNDMINGTKLLNITGMSRGKRDGILKIEKGRVVVKVGAMHLKGVW